MPEVGDTQLRIFDINGKQIYQEELLGFSGVYQKQMDISENSNGVYFITITQGNKSLSKKIVVQ